MKRRDFLKVGVAVSAGLTIPGCRPIPRVEVPPIVQNLDAVAFGPNLEFFAVARKFSVLSNINLSSKRTPCIEPKLILDYSFPYAIKETEQLPVVVMSKGTIPASNENFEVVLIDGEKPSQVSNEDEIFEAECSQWVTPKETTYYKATYSYRWRTADAWLSKSDAQKQIVCKYDKHDILQICHRQFWGWVEVRQVEMDGLRKTFVLPHEYARRSNLIYTKTVRYVNPPDRSDQIQSDRHVDIDEPCQM